MSNPVSLHTNKQIITALTAIKSIASVFTIYTQQYLHLISLKSRNQDFLQRSSYEFLTLKPY